MDDYQRRFIEPPSPRRRDMERVSVEVTRDFARSGANLHLRLMHPRTGEMAVVDQIRWRQIRPGEMIEHVQPLWLDDHQARALAEQVAEWNPETRRSRERSQMLEETRSELRSIANQLEEVRNHNTTLVRANRELQRQVRWFEREIRDLHHERRGES